jgi:hypothetical protein
MTSTNERSASLTIEQLGTGGTASGKFTRRDAVARTSLQGDDLNPIMLLTSVRTGEQLAEIDTSLRVHDAYDGTYIGTADTFEQALRMALGCPAYGYSWYAVKDHKRNWAPKGWAS